MSKIEAVCSSVVWIRKCGAGVLAWVSSFSVFVFYLITLTHSLITSPAREKVVGWYSTGPRIRAADIGKLYAIVFSFFVLSLIHIQLTFL